MCNKLVVFITLIAYAISHSTKYPHVKRNENCFKPSPAKIYSWHIHLIYWQTNDNHTKGAYIIRDKFIKAFNQKLGAQCTDLFHQNRLCMFKPDRQPVGPFLTAQWSIFVPPENFYETVSWMMQMRGGYDVLVHPNTGCELEDHSYWAFWGGKPWDINIDSFSHDQPFPWPERKSTAEFLNSDETSGLMKEYLREHET